MTYPPGWSNKGIKGHSQQSYKESKNYFRVFDEAGTNLMDSDLNENHEIVENHLRRLITDLFGYPIFSGDAFKIVESGVNNDFKILGGNGDNDYEFNARAYINGIPVVLTQDITYLTQPNSQPALNTPSGSNRTDYVYADLWLQELDYNDDPDIVGIFKNGVSAGTGMSTRLKVVADIKVSEGELPIERYKDVNGIQHYNVILAKLDRLNGDDSITNAMITDLRNTLNKYAVTNGGNGEPFALADGDTLTVIVDGGSTQTITFNAADFNDITQATAEEVVLIISKYLDGGTAFISGSGHVSIRSDKHGSDGSIFVNGGTAQTKLNFPSSTYHGSDGNILPRFLNSTVISSAIGGASGISVDTTNFNNILSSADDTVQKALDTIDDHAHDGTDIPLDTTNFDNNLSSADDTVQKAFDTLDDMASGSSTQVDGSGDSGAGFTDVDNIQFMGDGTYIETEVDEPSAGNGRVKVKATSTLINALSDDAWLTQNRPISENLIVRDNGHNGIIIKSDPSHPCQWLQPDGSNWNLRTITSNLGLLLSDPANPPMTDNTFFDIWLNWDSTLNGGAGDSKLILLASATNNPYVSGYVANSIRIGCMYLWRQTFGHMTVDNLFHNNVPALVRPASSNYGLTGGNVGVPIFRQCKVHLDIASGSIVNETDDMNGWAISNLGTSLIYSALTAGERAFAAGTTATQVQAELVPYHSGDTSAGTGGSPNPNKQWYP